jgi:hypothetical protein
MKPVILNMGKIHQADAAHSDVSIFLHEVEGRGEGGQATYQMHLKANKAQKPCFKMRSRPSLA